jgi:hypothetical protein
LQKNTFSSVVETVDDELPSVSRKTDNATRRAAARADVALRMRDVPAGRLLQGKSVFIPTSIPLLGLCFLGDVVQLREIAGATCGLLVRDQMIQRNEGNGNTENCSADALLPCCRELDTCDLRKDVNPNGRDADLVGYLPTRECLQGDVVRFKGSTEFLQCLEHRDEFSAEFSTHTSRSFVYRGSVYFMIA